MKNCRIVIFFFYYTVAAENSMGIKLSPARILIFMTHSDLTLTHAARFETRIQPELTLYFSQKYWSELDSTEQNYAATLA